MPLTQQEKATNRLRFEELGRGGNPNNPVIPSVDGAIDCTHVRLCHTKFGDHAESFRNRKNYFSLNVQVKIILLDYITQHFLKTAHSFPVHS